MTNMDEQTKKKVQEIEQAFKENDFDKLGLPKPSKGFGDTIAKMTKAIGIKPCGGCKKRQEWLNKKIPYKDSLDSSDMNE